MQSSDGPGTSKLLGLEIIRFICSFAVLMWHYRHFQQIAGTPKLASTDQPLYPLLAPFYDYGLYGVQLFWGISGFIFFWKYGEAISSGAVRAGRFAWLRFTRLYPLHLATLLIVALLQPIHTWLAGTPFIYKQDDAVQFLLQLGMATQWILAVPYTFNGPIWSVSAEVIVYAVFFVLAARATNRLRLCLVMMTGALILILLGIAAFPAVFCSAYFFAGGLAAELHNRSTRLVRDRLLALLSLATVAFGVWSNAPLARESIRPLILMVGLIPLLFLAAAHWSGLDRWERPIRAAGDITYSTYLCHFPLQLMLAIGLAYAGLSAPIGSTWFLLAYLATTMVVGHLVFTRFEKPVQDNLRKWARARSVAAA